MIFSLDHIVQWLLNYKYFVLFPLMVIEGPLVTMIAGSLASLGYLDLPVAYVVIVFGDLVGDSAYYAFGRFGTGKLVRRWGRYIGLNEKRVRRLERHFSSHGGKTLLLGKLTHVVGGAILVAAGMAKVPYTYFLRFNFVATLVKSLIFLLLGYYFAQAYLVLNKISGYATLASLLLVVLLLAVYIIINKIGAKKRGD